MASMLHNEHPLTQYRCFIPGARCTDASMFVRLPIHTYLLTYLPRVREHKDVIRTDAEDQEEAEYLEIANGCL